MFLSFHAFSFLPVAKISNLSTNAKLFFSDDSGQKQKAKKGDEIQEGLTLILEGSGFVEIVFPNGKKIQKVIRLEDEGALQFPKLNPMSTNIVLKNGSLAVLVGIIPTTHDFMLSTENGKVFNLNNTKAFFDFNAKNLTSFVYLHQGQFLNKDFKLKTGESTVFKDGKISKMAKINDAFLIQVKKSVATLSDKFRSLK